MPRLPLLRGSGWAVLLLAVGSLQADPPPPDPGALPGLEALLAEEAALAREADTVVTAARYAQRVDRTPSVVHVLDRARIQAAAPKSAADLLRLIPGLAVLRRQQLGHEVSALGVGGQFCNKVLVLLDGQRMTEPGFGSVPWIDLPVVVDELERVEVVLGPESTVYGTNAFAAVVHFITQGGDDEDRSHLRVAAGNRGYSTVTATTRQAVGDGSLRATIQEERRGSFGPLVDGAGVPDPAFAAGEDLRRRVARVSRDLRLGDDHRLRYSIATTQAAVAGPPHTPGVARAAQALHRGVYLGADYDRRLDARQTLTLRTSFFSLERTLSRPPLAALGVGERQNDASLADVEVRLRRRQGPWSLVGGATTRRVGVVGYLTPGADDDSRTTEVFAQAERDFSDRFVLYLGARQVFQDLADDELSWKLAGLYRPRRDTAWRFGVGTSFRQPDLITDRFLTATTLNGQPLNSPAFQGDPTIQSEVAREYFQLGWERRWARTQLRVDGYTAKLERLIGFVPFGPVVQTVAGPAASLGRPGLRFENAAAPARVNGVTVAGQRDLGALELHLSWTHQDVGGVPGAVDAPYAPERSGSVQLVLPPDPARRWSGSLTFTGVGPVDVDPNARVDGAAPRLGGYGTLDVALTRRLSPRVRATLSVRDLLDHQRREMIYSLIGDTREQGVRFGREVWLGVTVDL